MRIPQKAELNTLTRLSQLRERAALSELAQVTARRSAAAARIRDLQEQSRKAAKSQDVAVYQKWLLWRDQELTRRQALLARLSAEHVEASQRCGRVIAENAVVETLADLAETDAKEEAEKRRLYDQAMSSHLLSNDVGDQDV